MQIVLVKEAVEVLTTIYVLHGFVQQTGNGALGLGLICNKDIIALGLGLQ